MARYYSAACLNLDSIMLEAISDGNNIAGIRARELCIRAAIEQSMKEEESGESISSDALRPTGPDPTGGAQFPPLSFSPTAPLKADSAAAQRILSHRHPLSWLPGAVGTAGSRATMATSLWVTPGAGTEVQSRGQYVTEVLASAKDQL